MFYDKNNQQKKYMKQWKNECIKCRKEKPSWPWKKIETFLEGQNGKDIFGNEIND